MAKIVQLDELTINQIAAGEVIERPASVVKELVENSIDAGATQITVEIRKGGIEYIRITDNGSGIEKDDMEIAFERHATSKIRSAKDLDEVATMGFRGEALASIGAVAKVEMISKVEGKNAYDIHVESGDIMSFEETAAEKGTTIIVRNLFFNTPARYKFLKKDYTEAGYIEDNIRNLSLINKNIAFRLISNGSVILQTNGSNDFKNVVYSIFGKDVSDAIVEVDETYKGIRVTGVVGKPEISRSNRRNQIYYINKRYVKDKVLASATEKAFKGLVPLGRFGFCILNIEMNPELVDVNVHPAKLEVRFEREQDVFKAVYNAVKTGLSKEELVENVAKADFKFNKEMHKLTEDILNSDYAKDKNKNDDNNSEVNTLNENTENKYKYNYDYLKDEDLKNKIQNIDKSIKGDVSKTKIDEIISSYKKQYGNPNSILDEYEDTRSDLEKVDNKEEKNDDELFGKKIEEDEHEEEHEHQKRQDNNQGQEETEEETKKIDLKKEDENGFDHTIRNEKVLGETKIVNANGMETKILDNNDIENDEKNILKDQKLNEQQEQLKENPNIAEELLSEKLIDGNLETDILSSEQIRESSNNEEEINDRFEEMYKEAFGIDVIGKQIEKRKLEEELNVSSKLKKASNQSIFKGSKIPYKIIGVIFRTYIIIEISNEMYIIDQHAAHERVLFEKVKANYYSNEDKDIQQLLMPDVITLSGREYQLVRENMEIFKKAGFEVEEFGLNTIKLVGVPSMVEILNTKELFLDILDEIDGAVNSGRQEIENRFLATVACKAAVKANMSLSETEIVSLLDEMMSLENPFTCPHGRPTAIKMTKYDIERKFSRK